MSRYKKALKIVDQIQKVRSKNNKINFSLFIIVIVIKSNEKKIFSK